MEICTWCLLVLKTGVVFKGDKVMGTVCDQCAERHYLDLMARDETHLGEIYEEPADRHYPPFGEIYEGE